MVNGTTFIEETSMHDTDINQQITAVVRRRIKAGAEAKFEVLMQEFMAFALK